MREGKGEGRGRGREGEGKEGGKEKGICNICAYSWLGMLRN